MYPETFFSFEGQRIRVWSTGDEHLGFSCGSADHDGRTVSAPAIWVNRVEYRVRFQADRDLADGKFELRGEIRNPGHASEWIYYGRTVYINRCDAFSSHRNTGEPTESAEKKIVAFAHRVIAAFAASDKAEDFLQAGQAEFAKDELIRKGKAVKETREAQNTAWLDYLEAETVAICAGVDIKYFL